ncbi:MAG: mannitol dehydrogenase [Caldicoprobacterales bacterium]|nr:mannitol dehydrogenase [Clostridiales bacterium]
MKKAVMYGAGNIGRGFIGKVFSESGYRVCFLDIDKALIDVFNKHHEYDVKIVADDFERLDKVKNVYAVDANTEEAIKEIADCDIMATAVGVNVLPYIIDNIANGIKMRMTRGNQPLNIILAENLLDADKRMKEMIYEKLNKEEQEWADKNLGLVAASIGRMVPPLTEEERKKSPSFIAVEPYSELPVDSAGFKGPIPELAGLKPFTPFDFYTKRKLFMHNMGHAICAYLGWQKQYEYISEAVRDRSIYDKTKSAMELVVNALSREYPQIPLHELEANKEDLLKRFHNRALKDTIVRVAKDPLRKLKPNDRLVGAAKYCMDSGLRPDEIVEGIAAALKYDNPQDPAAVKIQADISSLGLDYVIENVMKLDRNSELAAMIKSKM